FVANANINTVAVFEVEEPGRARSLGFIPVGWYPTSVRVTPDGKRLLVANGKGVSSRSNRYLAQPGRKAMTGVQQYIGSLFDGTISFIDLPTGDAFGKRLAAWSERAFACVPDSARWLDPAQLEDNPIPRKEGDPTAIKYVIYIVKENRTYDQVLGDLERGNGDPSLCLFDEKIAPNHHALAREFVCLDNFYVESEVSADGHEWSMGAYATDFVEKNWPLTYGHDRRNKFPYPSEGSFDRIARPAGGYLWDRANEAGVSYRSYGEWVANGAKPDDPGRAKVKALEDHFDPMFRSFDMAYPDVKRAARFISELKRFEQEGDMPRLQIVRFPNDHTSGASPGMPTPLAHMADNDLAFGQVVEALSHSKFWPQMAIFVVEDDAQNGPDHVDAHRTIAFAISPFARRGAVDSSMYSTSSMLRTMELILGLKPMSQFDAAALPMFASFQKAPDLRPYDRKSAEIDMKATNPRTAWGADKSLEMDFSKEDAADDIVLNEVIWRSIRGADSPMPAPRRAAFVFTKADSDDDDDDDDKR
ncbi:MAG: alkaline phosphatase family protein, partial [Chthoniobacteraceae bacterium]